MLPELGRLDILPDKHQADFRESLHAAYQYVPPYLEEEGLWSPYVHTTDTYDRLVGIQRALQKGCLALLEAFPADDRLQGLLAPRFGEAERRAFAEAADVPPSTQFIRPDYIYDREGNPRICEINTRFIFNGNIAAVHMAEYLRGLYPVITDQYARLDRFMHDTYDGDDTADNCTVLVSESEPPHDLLLQEQRSAGTHSIDAELLRLVDARRIGRPVLELHQDELTPVLSDVIRLAREGLAVHNDPRVISLLHDKRLLVALSDETYMASLVDKETARTLADGIVPSYHPSWEGREPEIIPARSALAKGAISGKGDSLRIVRLNTFRETLESNEQYVYQSRLLQPKIRTASGEQDEIAGTLPMTLEEDVFGPGIVRILPHHRLHGIKGLTVAIKGEV